MTAVDSGAADLSRGWGENPSTLDLIAFAAATTPHAVAFTGASGPVPFGQLHAQTSMTAGVFAAQGMDTEAAVGASITGQLDNAGKSPEQIATGMRGALGQIRAAAFELAGSTDLGSLSGLFRSAAYRFGTRTALTDLRGASLTYAELDTRSTSLAAGLIAAGAGPERLVGVALDRDADLIVALLGIIKSGAAYLPLDRSHPLDRLTAIVDDAKPLAVLTDQDTAVAWASLNAPMATMADIAERGSAGDVAAIPARIDPAHPAYVMYTSGSTGKPKGVVVTHADVVTLLSAMGREYDFGCEDVWTMFQSYAFDVSVGEIWVSLAFGGRLVVLDYFTTRSPGDFVEVLEREQVTVVNLTPSAFYQLAGAVRAPAGRHSTPPGRLAQSIRYMIFVGEALDFEQVRRWHADRRSQDGNDGPQLNNMYGPTEATVYMTRRILTPEFVAATLASDVGMPLEGTRTYVLDSRLAKVPDGVPGDLYIAGDQLARGYAGRFALNATRFVADPFDDSGRRMYQTGDVAIVRNGSLEFLGRSDGQVKVRGFRIELGEVEAALLAAPGVNAAAATTYQRDDDVVQLVGYVVGVGADGAGLDIAKVRAAAGAKVPDYMVPDIIMSLDQLPLNVNGKLDRKALPRPVIAATAEFVAPRGHAETVIAGIFAEVLGIETISAVESVFDVGGNSLLAARIVGRACEELGVELNLRDLFEAPTVRGFAERAGSVEAGLPPIIASSPRPDRIPLSFAQSRMWFINQFDPTESTYNIPALLRLTGDLDVEALRMAVADAVIRHEVLRTTFPAKDGTPVQIIDSAESVDRQLDWQITDSRDDIVAAVAGGFDVTAQWPIRARLLTEEPGSYVFALVAHHIATDGESMLPLIADIVTAYTARAQGVAPEFPPLAVQFADYALWQHDVLGSADDVESVIGKQLSYWLAQLGGLPERLDLPADRPRPRAASHTGAQLAFDIPAQVGDRIAAVARDTGTTAFMVTHAAFAVLLARMTATDDIAIATPIAGRGQAALDHLVGMFVNTLVLRTPVDITESFADLLSRVRTTDLDAFAHADVPFESIVDAIDPVRSEAFAPLAQVMLSFDPAASAQRLGMSVAGVEFEQIDAPVVPAQLDISAIIRSGGSGQPWTGTLVYATDLFDESTIAGLADAFVRVLGELTADPSAVVGDVPLASAQTRTEALTRSRGPVVSVPPALLGDALPTRVAQAPDAVALIFGEREITYAEFGARVNQLAHQLISIGVGPEVAVGVAIDRSVEMMVAIHAVVAAGGHYVPIDTSAPPERVRYMTATACANTILVAAAIPPAVDGLDAVRLITVDATSVPIESVPVTDAERIAPLRPEHAAYTLFTSGSTGRPKGVTVTHAAIVNRMAWMRDGYGLSATDVFLQKTPYTFDVSVWELFLPLSIGASVVVAAPDAHRDPSHVADLVVTHSVSVIHFVPSMLSVFVDVLGERLSDLISLRRVFASGEALTSGPAGELIRANSAASVVNLYGPTEAAVDVTEYTVRPGDLSVPIGEPVWNTTTLVLDARLRPVPADVPGELYLGGVQLARGYASRGDLTADRFVADPYSTAGERLYRTGDLVRWNTSGQIEYLGRTDFQVKLRGQRIELGEIEAVLASAPGVVHAAATVVTAPGGGEHLVAYLAGAREHPDLAEVRAVAGSALPSYMVPSVWMVLDEITLNSAGKIDRRALPAPEFADTESGFSAPLGAIEEQLAAMVAGVLGRDRVSVTESFFALGGDSIMSIQLAAAVRAAGLHLSPREIFEYRTVRAMAAAIGAADRQIPPLAELPGGGAGEATLPPAASWMLEFARTPTEFADFSQAVVLVAPAGLTRQLLSELIAALVAEHPMLTARLEFDDLGPHLVTGDEFDSSRIEVIESADGIGTPRFDADLLAAHASAAAQLDPMTGRLVGAALVRASDGRSRVVIAVHHLGVDAVSWRTIVEDLATGWGQHEAGEPYRLRGETTSARTWFAALGDQVIEREAERDYWLDRLPATPTDFGAPLEPARDVERTSSVLTRIFDAELTEVLLRAAPEAFGGNVNDILLGAFARAVRSWQGVRGLADTGPVSVLAEGHGRYEEVLASGPDPRRADLSRTVGWFTAVAPLNLDPGADIVHAVKAAKEERLGQPDNGIGFGLLRYGGDDELRSRPLPSVIFNYLGAAAGGAGAASEIGFVPDVAAPVLPGSPSGAMAAMAALTVNVDTTVDNGLPVLRATLRFPVAVLSDPDVADLAERWTSELAAVGAALAQSNPGLSPSDVPGVAVSQDDLDALAARFGDAAIWPLAPLQRGLYFQAEMAGDAAVDVYVTQAVLHLGPDVDLDRLRKSVGQLVARHRVLRSGFVRTASGSIVAVVPDSVDVPWSVVDVTDPTDSAAERVARIALEQKTIPFNLAEPPLLRVVVVRHADGVDVVITNHHILFDGWSGPLVLADLMAIYATGKAYTNDPAEGDFADFLNLVARTDATAGLAAWREVLSGVDGPTIVAPTVEATAESMPRVSAVVLDNELIRTLESVARQHNSTLATVLQSAWAILLARVTGNRVVTFGETVSGRPAELPGAESAVGLFINTLPVVVDVDPETDLGSIVERLQRDKIAVLDHQHLVLPDIIAASGLPVGFDTLTIHESYPVDTESLSALGASASGDLDIRGIDSTDATHYPLNMVTSPMADGLSIELKYLPGAFADEQITVFAAALVEILRAFAERPRTASADVGLMNSDALARVRELEWGARPTPPPGTVADVTAAWTRRSPQDTALWFEGREVSYVEFAARVNTLAHELISMGVGPDSAVAVCIGRSVEMMVAIHAIVAAGGQYVPIDQTAPGDRVEYMLATSGARILLLAEPTAASAAAEVAASCGARIVVVDSDVEVELSTPPVTDAQRLAPLRPDHAVYTLFTSGSTGRPKGVTLSHAAVVNRLWWGLDELPIDATDVVVQKTPYTFDCSVPELFAPLMVGATLVVLNDGGHLDPLYVADTIERTRATMVHFVPSMLSVFAEIVGEDRIREMDSVRIISTTGEALPPGLAAQVRDWLPEILFYNLYGPTEAAIEITYEKIRRISADDLTVPIGVPVWNSSAVVLDSRLRRVPPGIPGELYLGGVQLARGYAARGDLTADRFIADPYGEPGARLYRTGDLVRRTVDGNIEYLGRTDFQVKLRGQRVELGEIESVLAGAPGVVHAAATVAEGPGGSQHLVGYLAGRGGDVLDLEAIKNTVAESLPVYMVPTVWMVLDDIALNSAGKIDRNALPEPDFGGVEAEFAEPETEDEAALARVFADVLGVARVSVADSFFDLGGNSLSAMRLAARAGEVLGVDLSVRDLFEAPTVRALLAASTSGPAASVPIVAVVPRPDVVPLSFAQQRMWFINRFEPDSPVYNLPAVLRLTGALDTRALRAAVVDIVARHEILRTVFPAIDGVPHQQVCAVTEFDDRDIWRTVGSEAELFAAAMAGFDLTGQWPLRVVLHSDGDEHVLAVISHHIAADGESSLPLVTDLLTAYVARSAGAAPLFAPLEVQYADYALWQHRALGSADDSDSVVGRQLSYWTEQLAGLPDVLDLPTDRPRAHAASHRGQSVDFAIPGSIAQRIGALAQSQGATPFMVLHAALAVVLARLSTSTDIAIATPVSGRGHRVLERLIGMFVNTLVLRTEIDSADTFRELLDEVRTVDLDAFAHADVPFETVVDAVDPVRSEAFAPLAQVLLSFDPGASVNDVDVSVAGLNVSPLTPHDVPAQLDLYITVSTDRDGAAWQGSVTFETDLFDPLTVESMMARYVDVLDAVTTDPDAAVGDAAMLPAGEVAVLRGRERGANIELPAVVTLPDAIVRQIARSPERAALESAGRSVSYREFGARVNTLARELISMGIGPDTAVALAMPRSVEMVVAIHAVTAAGGQYVPIDTTAPAERAAYMMDTAAVAALLVVDAESVASVVVAATERGLPVLGIDASGEVDLDSEPVTDADRVTPLRADHACYTLFTSGSTGRPKGVTLSHRAVLNRLWWGLEELPIDQTDTVMLKTPYTFDVSVPELFAPLMVGACMTILTADGHLRPTFVADEISRTRTTMVHFVPSMLSVFCEVVGRERISSLTSIRIVSATGEALPPAVAAELRAALPSVLFYNLYGPTEAAVEITYEEIETVDSSAPSVAIGVPVWNSSSVVLDSRLHRVADGVAGELYLGGVQLARGYAARPELTAERFVADPFGSGERLYRTGDLVRRRADGVLEYLGRTDFQVKLRGQRIELGEIESALSAVSGVVHAAATVLDAADGVQHLVGYVSPSTVDVDLVKDTVAQSLPVYMVPSVWVAFDDVTLNSAGKLDRKALPAPVFTTDDYVAPETPAERELARVFADVLGVERVSVADSFFDIGGNSLSAMRLAARVGELRGAEVGVRDIFAHPSIRELAAIELDGAARPSITAAVPRPERVPLSFAQQRMWYVNQLDPNSSAYNIPVVLRLSGPLDVPALRAAVGDLIVRHEVLRTLFPERDGQPVQQVHAASEVDSHIDWQIVDSQEAIAAAVSAGFDVSTQYPIRFRLWPAGDDDHVLAIVTQHIASDGESLAPLVTDLVAAYLARSDGRVPEFAPLAVQFADYAIWQHQVLGAPDDATSVVGRQLSYWTTQLAGLPDVIDLPTDRPRPAVATQAGAQVVFDLPAQTSTRIAAIAQEAGATNFMVVHAALAVLLARLSAADDIAIGTPIAGRGQQVLDPLIGMFVNTLVLRTRIDGAASFADVLADTKAIDLDAFANADVPFETIVEAVDPVRSSAFAPLSQVWLTFNQTALPELAGAELSSGEVAGLRVSPVAADTVPARVDLLVNVVPAEGQAWQCSIVYATDLFDSGTVRSLADRLITVLDTVLADTRIAVGDIILDAGQPVAELLAPPPAAEPAPAPVVEQHAAVITSGRGTAPVLLADLFVDAAQRHGMRQAVVDADGVTLTYTELDQRSNRLARWLIAQGIGPEKLVALAIKRSATLLTAIWAVAKSGGGYVPIDPDYPAERVANMVEDSGAVLGLSVTDAGDLPEHGFDWVRLDDSTTAAHVAGLADVPITDTERLAPVRISNTAYVIYTSGSTGRPKGVAVTHSGLANFATEEMRRSGADEYSRVLGFASPSFDASVLEYLLATITGGVLVYRPSDAIGGEVLSDYMMRQAVTHTFLTPTVLSTLDAAVLPALRVVYAGGEAVPAALKDQWAPFRRIQNLYGPTETTIGVTIGAPMAVGEAVTLGGPIDGVGLLILDNRLRPAPVGVPGELYVCGEALSRGYLDRPGLTSDRFVANPFGGAGDRMYRTGDVVRWHRDASGQAVIEYSGRSDDQVKLRGLRIELGEIETALAEHPSVSSAVVVGVRDDGGIVDSGESVISGLAGYVVSTADVDVAALRQWLTDRLPEYMVPGSIAVLESLPLTPVGKLDRAGLPAPELGTSAAYEAPANAAEEQLAAIVGGLLGVDRVSVAESFFALGGDSIMSIQLASAAKSAGIVLTPRQIFEHKTIRGIVAASGTDDARIPELAEPEGGGAGLVPLTPIVSWMLEKSDSSTDFADFSQSAVLQAPADLTVGVLTDLLDAVVSAHPMLSATLTQPNGVWELSAGSPGRARVAELASAHRIDTESFGDDVIAAFEQASARLDPATGHNVAAVLVRAADGAGRVVLVVHHLATDAVSWRALIEDVVTAWAHHAAGQEISLRGEATSMRAWAGALFDRIAERSDEVDYWLARTPEKVTNLGVHFDRARDRAHTVHTLVEDVPAQVTEAILTTVPQAFGGAVNDPLIAAFARAVRSWQADRGIDDDAPVSILMEGHGRYEEVLAHGPDAARADLSRTVGWFTTIEPMRFDPSGDIAHAVKAAKEERLSKPAEGIGFGLLRYGGSPELAARPLPPITFNYLGNVAGGQDTSGDLLPAADAPRLPGTVRGDMVAANALTVNVDTVRGENGRSFSAVFGFPSALFASEDIADLARRWTEELHAIVDFVATVGDPGLSPSDVSGVELSQHDLDLLAQDYPGAVVWPLSPLQRGFVFQAEMAAANPDAVDVYIAQATLELGGDIDIDRLRGAAQSLLASHRVLRSGYVRTASGTVVAVVPPNAAAPWSEVDLGGVDAQTFADSLTEIVDQQRVEPFDLSSPPLMRFVLVHNGSDVRLVVTSHHILIDGWSSPLLIADLLALYATGQTYTGTINTSGNDFGDFLALPGTADDEAGLTAWRQIIAPLESPTLVSRGAEATHDQLPADHTVFLDPELSAGIESVARSRGVTVSTITQFAWAVLLSQLTGNRVVTFGETVSGRPADLDGVDAMVGLFINTLPAVVDVDPSATIGEVLDRLQAAKVSVLDYQHIGLPEITALTRLPVLFDTLAVHESYPINTQSLSQGADLPGGAVLRDVTARDATHYPLNLGTTPAGDRLEVKIKYLPGVFAEDQVVVFADVIERVLRAAVHDVDALIGDIALVDDPTERDSRSVGKTIAVVEQTAADLLAAQANNSPDAAAVRFGDRMVSYAEYGARVATLARRLIESGVGPDVAVAVCLPRSIEMAVAIGAVVAAGGHYLPVDVESPADRVRYMFDTADVAVLLVHHSSPAVRASEVAVQTGVVVETVDAEGATDLSAVPVTDADRLAPLLPDHAAYTLFTSGSTGRPKGVTVTHRALISHLTADQAWYEFDASDVFLQVPEYTFDPSVADFFRPLVVGGTLVLLAPGEHRDPHRISAAIDRYGVTSAILVPSLLSAMVDTLAAQGDSWFRSLTRIHTGGEPTPPSLLERIGELWPTVAVHNQYGPTETTIYVTVKQLRAGNAAVSIGGPIANCVVLVLDSRLRPVPVGIPGELYLGGVQVARGYAGRPGLTASRFVPDPFGEPGGRLYRSGDMVRWSTTGELEYLGRTDFQVKLHGQRIELGEIEAALIARPDVIHAAAVVAVAGGDDHIVAYVAPSSVDVDAAKQALAQVLPEFMRPTVWMKLDELPFTASDKVDRNALPEPVIEAVEYVGPADEREALIAELIADVLGIDRVSVTASFFDVGGNSLSATRVAARVSDAFDADVSVRDLFAAPSARELAAVIVGGTAVVPPVTAISPRPETIPLSFAQQRMWFINQFDTSAPTYNIPIGLRLTGALDVDAVRAAVGDVVARHEILRTTFPAVDGVPMQLVHAVGSPAAAVDWAQVQSNDDLVRAASTGFDVARDVGLRVRLLSTAADDHVLMVVMHHIVGDGESTTPLVTDMVTAYLARAAGTAPSFAPLPVQFADYALWQHTALGSADEPDSIVGRQIDYWTTALAGLPDVLELPADRPRPAVASHRGDLVEFEIPRGTAMRIEDLAHRSGVTPFMVLHAALSVLLARTSGTDDIAVATPVAGRGSAVLDPLVGMFVNTLVLRAHVDVGQSFGDLLTAIRATDLSAFGNADLPFESLVDQLNPVRSQAFSPLAQIMLNVSEEVDTDLLFESEELSVTPLELPTVPAQLDLTFNVVVAGFGDAWPGSLIYATDLFDATTVRDLVDRWLMALDALTAHPEAAVGDAPLVARDALSTVLDRSIGESDPSLATELRRGKTAKAALVVDERKVSYAEFDARVAVLARELIAAGVGPDVAVAVCIPRSAEMMLAIHAIFTAGGHYVPIDVDTPADRVHYMLGIADAALVLVSGDTTEGEVATAARANGARLMVVDASTDVSLVTEPVTDAERVAPIRGDHAAYTLFTSGSTGRPKGVTISRAALANRLGWMHEAYPIAARDVVLQKTPYTFDVSVWELFWPLQIGATLVIAEPGRHGDAQYLARLIDAHRVSVMHFVPSMLSAFIDVLGERLNTLVSLRYMFTSGEALTPAVAQAVVTGLPRLELHNLYGPTEAAVDVTSHQVLVGEAVVPIGRPVPNTTGHVLDARLQPVPVGVPGELYLGGVQLARAYAGQSDLTSERFVADPIGPAGGRLYRTGDVVRWNTDGELEYLGRSDFQVKLRGQRL
ncbi:putative non-ribosomal peptide synthetase, partial [Gordonia effusa NBRC 100432]